MSASRKSSLRVQLKLCKSYVTARLQGISNESFHNRSNSCPSSSGWQLRCVTIGFSSTGVVLELLSEGMASKRKPGYMICEIFTI